MHVYLGLPNMNLFWHRYTLSCWNARNYQQRQRLIIKVKDEAFKETRENSLILLSKIWHLITRHVTIMQFSQLFYASSWPFITVDGYGAKTMSQFITLHFFIFYIYIYKAPSTNGVNNRASLSCFFVFCLIIILYSIIKNSSCFYDDRSISVSKFRWVQWKGVTGT